MKEMLKSAIEALTAVYTDVDKLGGLAQALTDTETKLASANGTLAELTEAIESKRGFLDANRQAALARHDTMMYENDKRLKNLQLQVKAAKAELDELRANINTALEQHRGVMASIDSLRKKLA
jgi:chromosome segregation ATPase